MPPQVTHWLLSLHASPDATQNGAILPLFTPPGQQGWLAPPHALPWLLQLPLSQVPSTPPQGIWLATQRPALQQAPASLQLLFAQQGCPAAPHAVAVPFTQAFPAVVVCPEATQLEPPQQPPPEQVLPVQHAVPGRPQRRHCPALQLPPVEHIDPPATQTALCASQQPPLVQALAPWQQGCPAAPQAVQTSFAPQASPAPVQALPAQQGWPGPPHCTHELLLQVRSALPQVRFAQQACPGPPHATHEPATHAVADAVHRFPVQHGCPAAPQVPHDPVPQVPPTLGQVEPAPVQTLLTQHPPPPQLFAAQHATPAVPHAVQMLF